MVLAKGFLKTEHGDVAGRFLDELLKKEGFGVAYALADNRGNVIVSGISDGGSERDIGKARIKAVAAIVFGKDTSEFEKSKTGNEYVDTTVCSGGGMKLVSNGVIYGSIGIVGRQKPINFKPCDSYYDSDIAILLSRELIESIEAESGIH